jgi:dipeptidase E
MRLYLSSYRLGNEPTVLSSLAGDGRRAGVCMNACDVFEDRRRVWPREQADMESLGFEVSEVDLRDHFDDRAGLREQLTSIDVLWVVGGNTFTLARAMHASGFATIGTDLVTARRLTYAGYSAGVCVVTPDFEGIHLMDDPAAVAQGYPADTPPAALGWLPWRVVPHWDSDHEETQAADLAVNYLLKAELPFRTLRDGHAIVVDNTETRVVGSS